MRRTPDIEKMLEKQLGADRGRVNTCSRYDENFLTAYLESSLSPARLAEFEKHLIGCPSCREAVATLSNLFQQLDEEEEILAASESAPAPPSMKPSLFDRLFGSHSGSWRWAVAAAAFAAIIGLPLYFVLQQPRVERMASQTPEPAMHADDSAVSTPRAQPELKAAEKPAADASSRARIVMSNDAETKPIEWNVGVQVAMNPEPEVRAKSASGDTNSVAPAAGGPTAPAPAPREAKIESRAVQTQRSQFAEATVAQDQTDLSKELPSYAERVKDALVQNLKKQAPTTVQSATVIVQITVEKDGHISNFHPIGKPKAAPGLSDEKEREAGPLKVVSRTKFPAFPKALADHRDRLTLIVSLAPKR